MEKQWRVVALFFKRLAKKTSLFVSDVTASFKDTAIEQVDLALDPRHQIVLNLLPEANDMLAAAHLFEVRHRVEGKGKVDPR